MTGGYIDDRDKLRMELVAVNTGTMWSLRFILRGGKRLMACFAGGGGNRAAGDSKAGKRGRLEMLLLPQKCSKG
jgi:hypothetical protein